MVDMPWDVFFWSALGPGGEEKSSQKPCWWKKKVGGGGTREVKEMQEEWRDQKREKGTSQAWHWATLVPVASIERT